MVQANYNSAVATFCNNIANGLPIQVNDRNVRLDLVYIDDLMEEMFRALDGKEHRVKTASYVPEVHQLRWVRLSICYTSSETAGKP